MKKSLHDLETVCEESSHLKAWAANCLALTGFPGIRARYDILTRANEIDS